MENKTLYIWSEDGNIFCMEEGDYNPMNMDTHIYEKDANDYVCMEVEELIKNGYEIKVGRPKELSDGWEMVGM